MTFKIIGKTDGFNFRPTRPEFCNSLLAGDIVQDGNEVYRVYTDPQKGLRYWNVTDRWNAEREETDLDNTHESFLQGAR